MFQLHYAIGVFLVGTVIGAFTTKSTIARGVLLVAGFTMTFGVHWGFVTLIELAIGFMAGNIFLLDENQIQGCFTSIFLTPGSILAPEPSNTRNVARQRQKQGRRGGANGSTRNLAIDAPLKTGKNQEATAPAPLREAPLARTKSFTWAKCDNCGHQKVFSTKEIAELERKRPQLFKPEAFGSSRMLLSSEALRCTKCGSKETNVKLI